MNPKYISIILLILLLAGYVPASADQQTATPTGASDVITDLVTDTANGSVLTYPIVDTAQGKYYHDNVEEDCPQTGESFYYRQDAQYTGTIPGYSGLAMHNLDHGSPRSSSAICPSLTSKISWKPFNRRSIRWVCRRLQNKKSATGMTHRLHSFFVIKP